jgi:hypothetical protein
LQSLQKAICNILNTSKIINVEIMEIMETVKNRHQRYSFLETFLTKMKYLKGLGSTTLVAKRIIKNIEKNITGMKIMIQFDES